MTIQDLVKEMVKRDSSDIYVTAELPPMYRTEGVTEPWETEKFSPEQTKELAYSIMNDRQKKEFEEKKEMNLALHFPELGRFRVNIFLQRGNIGMVIRLIKLEIKTIDQLGLPGSLKDIIMAKRGLVLVVGAAGTGKSTTLAAMIDHRNSNLSGHIISIEDPIEFVHQHKKSVITQREIGFDTHSFEDALKNTLRQAPDVILIGEIRDTETMESAISFSETGHLCLGTLHANNANQAIERVMNFFPVERHPQIYLLLSLNLKAIISQRLVPKTLKAIISQRLVPIVEGKRIAAVEILIDTPRVKDLILKGEIGTLKEVMAEGTQEGMQTFDQSLFYLYKAGNITYDDAIAYADSANDLRLRIKMDEIGDNKDETEPAFKIKSNEPLKRR